MKMDSEYQDKHLEFISHNNGSTIQEIVLAGLPLHLSPLLVCLCSLLPWDTASFTFRLFEFITVLFPPLLSLTIFADAPEYVNAVLAALVLVVILVIVSKKKGAKEMRRVWELRLSEDDLIESITNYRSSMLLVTAICILAVDFPIFPRKFGKTESFGYGLMDLGVGGFVFAAGLTAPEGRGKETNLFKTLKSSLPLLVLGAARLAVVSVTGYHSNVSEYGQHWNFFFTLFFVKMLGTLMIPFLPGGRNVWVSSVVTAVLYEGILSFGYVDWILSDAPRDGLVAGNREGLFSTLGFLAIYLAGVSWAREIITKPFTFMSLINSLTDCLVWSVLMWLSLFYSTTFFLPPSRRLCNYTFYTFVVAYNLSILTAFLAMEAGIVALKEWKTGCSEGVRKEKKNKFLINKRKQTEHEVKPSVVVNFGKGLRSPTLHKAISLNPLPFFLLANILTGLVNTLVPTLETEGCPAVLILSAYLTVLGGAALLLKHKNIKLI